MQLYVSKPDLITGRDLYRAERAAEMSLSNEVVREGRHGGDTLVFNGYGGSTRSNRRPNERVSSGEYAATWDQWGILLGVLFTFDPMMRVGGYKRPYYLHADDFHWQTDGRFRDVARLSDLTDFHGDHSWTFSGSSGTHQCRRCTAVRRRFGSPFQN